MKNFSIVIGMTLLFPFFSFSQVFVDASRPDNTGDGLSLATAKQTINAGIGVATAGQTVFIAAGTYAGCTLNKSVNLQGAGIGLTIIQGSGAGSGINITTSISNVTISNLRVTNFNFGMIINNASISISDITLQNVSLVNNNNFGFRVNNANTITDLQIIDSEMNNNGTGFGITNTISSLSDLSVNNSQFNNNNGRGMALGSSGNLTNVSINNSEFNNNLTEGFFISRNTSSNVSNVSISNSIFTNNEDAIQIRPNNSFSGFSVSDCNFSGNIQGIVFRKGALTTGSVEILNNIVEMTARSAGGIAIYNSVGSGLATGSDRVIVSGNRVFQSATGDYSRDIAGIIVGSRRVNEPLSVTPEPSGVVIIGNIVENIQPGDGTCAGCGGVVGNGFGIVVAGNNHRILNNVVSGCEIGIQLQAGNINAGTNQNAGPSPLGAPNTLYFDMENAATANGNIIRYNNITGYILKAIRGLQNSNFLPNDVNDFTGNWLGSATFTLTDVESYLVSDPAIATFTAIPNINVAFNPWAAVDLDDVAGNASGQRGVQINSAKEYRATATETTTSIGVIPQGILIANTAFKDVLDIRAGVYNIENDIIVNKRIRLLGDGGSVTRPEIVMLPAPAAVLSLFVASAQNITIENLHLKVLGNKAISPPTTTGVHGIFVNNHTTSLSYNNLEILNNFIENITPIDATLPVDVASFAIRFTSPTGAGSGNNSIRIEGNTISSELISNFFGRGIRSFGNNGLIQNNTITAGLYGLQWADITNGTLSVTNNIFNALFEAGVEINTSAINNVTHTVSNNIFNAVAPTTDAPFALLEFKNMAVGSGVNSIVNVNNNTFNGVTQYGIFAGRSRNLNIANNTFTPNPAATNFHHICLNTKHRTTGGTGAAITSENIIIRGNTLNGNGNVGTGIFFANHHSGAPLAFNNITIGGAGAGEANNFPNSLTRFIALDPHLGTSNAATLNLPLNAAAVNPWLSIWANPLSPVTATTMAATTGNFNAQNNNFDIGTGLKTPATMTNEELIRLENRVSHKIDHAPLGFVTVKPNHIFVTQESFIAPNFTTEPRIRRGTDVANADGFTLNVEGFTYTDVPAERPNTVFNMDFVPVITDAVSHPAVVSPHWEMNGTGKILNLLGDLSVSTQVVFNDGNIQTNTNTLNFTPTAIDPAANPVTVGEKDNSRILGRARTIRNVGAAAFDFLGLNLPAGADLGTLDLTRISDIDGIVTTPTGISIACTWLIEPSEANGRNGVSFRWLPAINNGKDVNQLQAWRNNGTDWETRSGIFAATATSPLIETIAIDVTAFSPWTISDIINPLPVEMLYIQATMNANKIPEVQWATTSEFNTDYFEVERSYNAKDFVKIGSIKSKGNNSSYIFEDKQFSSKAGVIYYRLRQVDKNQKFSYSRVVSVSPDSNNYLAPKIYPNPTMGTLFVEMLVEEPTTMRVADMYGKELHQFVIATPESKFELGHLPKGVYFLQFESSKGRNTIKLVIN